MKRYGVIYKITNKIDGKVYIGQTVLDPPNKRIKWHFQKSSDSVLCRAVKKHGKKTFKTEIILTCFDEEYLNEMEKFYIKKFNCIAPNGYNLDSGGYDNRNRHPQSILKGKLKNKKRIREKGSPLKGVPKSKEHRKTMSKVRKGFDSKNRKWARERAFSRRRRNGEFVRVTAINIETGEEFKFDTINQCAKELGLDTGNVSRVCRGVDNRTQHKGYRFVTEKYGESLPKKPDTDLKYIRKINKGGYSVVIKNKYIGWRKELEDAIELRDCHQEKTSKEAAERAEAGTLKRKK